MKKKLVLFMTMFLLLGQTTTVFGEITNTKAGTCTFDGDKMDSSFDSNSIAVAVSEMEPGDTVNFAVEIKNTSEDETSWYMSNTVISSLEDAQEVAENGGYTYVLTYTDSEGNETTLYDSDSVGGEKESAVGVGLNEATDSLDEFFFLDGLQKSEGGTVNLKIILDGESQGNIYQDTLAKLKMNFAVEKGAPKDEDKPDDDSDKTKPKVKTGDIWMGSSIILLLVGITLVGIALFMFKKGGKTNEKNC